MLSGGFFGIGYVVFELDEQVFGVGTDLGDAGVVWFYYFRDDFYVFGNDVDDAVGFVVTPLVVLELLLGLAIKFTEHYNIMEEWSGV